MRGADTDLTDAQLSEPIRQIVTTNLFVGEGYEPGSLTGMRPWPSPSLAIPSGP